MLVMYVMLPLQSVIRMKCGSSTKKLNMLLSFDFVLLFCVVILCNVWSIYCQCDLDLSVDLYDCNTFHVSFFFGCLISFFHCNISVL